MAANGAALAVYAGSPAMADPTLLGRLGGIAVPTLVLWGESDQIVEPAYGRAYAAAIPGRASRCCRPPGTCPRWRLPISSCM
jgi:pimeloyl-ACP methyl ester carboxylesterase